jgi:ribosomal protein S18 acetylase RimI-like enzyme
LEQVDVSIAQAADAELADGVRRLVRELSSSPNPPLPSAEELREMLQSPSTTLFVARAGGELVGMLALVVFRIPSGVRAFVEDVVVDARFRGRGIGEALTARALELARARGARTVDLTSRPMRTAANALYRKMGFEKRDTNVYRYVPR